MGARPEGPMGGGANRQGGGRGMRRGGGGGGRGMRRGRGPATGATPGGSPAPGATPAPAAPGQAPAGRGPLTPEQRQARRERRIDRFTQRAADFTERSQLARDRASRIEKNIEAGKGRFAPTGEFGVFGPAAGETRAQMQRERADRLKQKAENMRARADKIRGRGGAAPGQDAETKINYKDDFTPPSGMAPAVMDTWKNPTTGATISLTRGYTPKEGTGWERSERTPIRDLGRNGAVGSVGGGPRQSRTPSPRPSFEPRRGMGGGGRSTTVRIR